MAFFASHDSTRASQTSEYRGKWGQRYALNAESERWHLQFDPAHSAEAPWPMKGLHSFPALISFPFRHDGRKVLWK
jgi:hypothetical protein